VNTDVFLFGRLSSILSYGYLILPVFGKQTVSETKNTDVILSLDENRHMKLPAELIKVSYTSLPVFNS
jgi:hypothetical protein